MSIRGDGSYRYMGKRMIVRERVRHSTNLGGTAGIISCPIYRTGVFCLYAPHPFKITKIGHKPIGKEFTMEKNIPYKTYLEESEMPKQWYNVRADMKTKPAPLLNPGTLKPMTVEELSPVFCTELAK